MIIATVITAIIAVLAFLLSCWNFYRNLHKSVDFFAEIKTIKKDEDRVHGEDEELNLYLVNQGLLAAR